MAPRVGRITNFRPQERKYPIGPPRCYPSSGRPMRITICLSERVTADLVESAKAFDLPIERVLDGSARVAEMFETMASTGGQVAVN